MERMTSGLASELQVTVSRGESGNAVSGNMYFLLLIVIYKRLVLCPLELPRIQP
jgi:hypothetical protein